MVRVGILGALQLERDGHAIELAGDRLRALVARLALAGGGSVSTGALVDAVWDGELPADQQHALQSLISRARRALGGAEVIAAAPGGYRLAVDEVDAQRFEELVAAGEPREALALWRGPALAGMTSQPLAAAAARLEDQRLTALADYAEAQLALGNGAALVNELEHALAEHPLHERVAACHLSALAAAGRQADALGAYERIRARLADELGAAPSPELQAAHLAVLQSEAPRARRTNLRAPVTSFIGRDAEVQRIGEALTRSRLVTLVGPGGAGKTRLASEALASWVERVRDGVWMVELAPVNAAVEIEAAVLAALGLREGAVLDRVKPRDGLERLLDALAERETILLLDNCEHLIDAAAQLADHLLAGCPELRIVATSREPLAIAGESVVPIPPLELEAAAVRLFRDRAIAASPSFAADDAVVLEICRRLDGLPLAIELAAARLRTMGVEQLAARLDDRFRLLTGGSRAALPRHRTLRAVVDWSWELLSESERTLARRFAVFNGGATEESAAAVTDDPNALDGLAALADRSLLQVVGDRFRMLETIREYALEKLDEAGELHATRDAHARYFAALAEESDPHLRDRRQREAYARLQAEHDDVIAALRWLGDSGDRRAALRVVVSLLWFWMLSGAQDEARAWVEFAVAVDGEGDPVDELIAEGLQTVFDAADGEERGPALAALAERIEREHSTHPLVALARPMLALLAGDPEVADRRMAETLEHPDPWTRAAALLMRAHIAENAGDQEHMRADLERAAEAFRDLGDEWARAMTLSSQSSTLMLAGDLDGAETVLDEATELLRTLGEASGITVLWLRLAEVRVRRGDLDGARELVERVTAETDLRRDESVFVRALLARIAWLAGDIAEVRRLVTDATARLKRVGERPREQGHAQATIGALTAALEIEDGDLEAAATSLDAAIAVAAATTDMPIVANVGTIAAMLSLRSGRLEDAAEQLGACVVLRGAEDRTNPDVAWLHGELAGFEDAYARGRGLDREAAIARLSSGERRQVGSG